MAAASAGGRELQGEPGRHAAFDQSRREWDEAHQLGIGLLGRSGDDQIPCAAAGTRRARPGFAHAARACAFRLAARASDAAALGDGGTAAPTAEWKEQRQQEQEQATIGCPFPPTVPHTHVMEVSLLLLPA